MISAAILRRLPVDITNKRKYPPKPLGFVRKRAMTIAVGILAEGSIVLASDTKYYTGTVVNYGEKVFPLPARASFRVVVAGAGVVETIRGASEKIGAILPSKPTPLDNIQQAIERANKDYYERFIVPLRDPDAGYELLIAIQHESEGCRLLKCQQNSTRIVDDSAMLGTGGLTAQPYSDLWWPDISLLEAEIMACCLVRYAKDYDELCGGETRVFTLTPDGLFRLDDAYIRQADDYFLNFHRFAVKMLLPFDSLKADSDFFEGQLSSLVKDLKRYRETLAREHQRAHYKIP